MHNLSKLEIGNLVVTIDPEDYKLEDGKLEMKFHIKGPKFEGDVIIGKWLCYDCGTINDIDTICCSKCGMDIPGESNR